MIQLEAIFKSTISIKASIEMDSSGFLPLKFSNISSINVGHYCAKY